MCAGQYAFPARMEAFSRSVISRNTTQLTGTNTKVISTENRMPNASVTAIGRIFSASELCTLMNGNKPTNVVVLVRKIARNRALQARITV